MVKDNEPALSKGENKLPAVELVTVHPEHSLFLVVQVGEGHLGDEKFNLSTNAANGAFTVNYRNRYATLDIEKFTRLCLQEIDKVLDE